VILRNDSMLVEGGTKLVISQEVIVLYRVDWTLVLPSSLLVSGSLLLKEISSCFHILSILIMILLSVSPSSLYNDLITRVVLTSVISNLTKPFIILLIILLVISKDLVKLALLRVLSTHFKTEPYHYLMF
jgi:ABC-type methionine transport system permease subunit